MRTLRRLARNSRRAAVLEAQYLPQLGVEGLHDAVAGDGLMQDVLNLGQLVLPGAGARPHLAPDFARRSNHHRDKQQQRPAQFSAQADDQHQADEEREKLLEELADHGADRILHAVHVVDQGGENRSGGVLVEEAGGAAQRGFVEMIAQVGDQCRSRHS